MSAEGLSATNIGATLTATANRYPDQLAVAAPRGRGSYRTATFQQLEADTNRLAAGLLQQGFCAGQRVALLVPPSWEFLALTFALFKAGAVIVLIDPGMGGTNLVRCLSEVQPEGLVGVPRAQATSRLLREQFSWVRLRVTAGRRWLWGGTTVRQLLRRADPGAITAATRLSDPAAIIFTTGSTGPPKGVLYRHGNFLAQVDQIRKQYAIEPGEVDLPGFPLFGLFNAAMGVTTVIPRMDPTRPARVDPRQILAAAERWKVTQSFGSPAMWNTISRYCQQHGKRFSTLRRVLSAGAPVPPHVLERTLAALPPGAEMHTPYGATEALPVATVSAREVLDNFAARSASGAGTCVGKAFSGIRWRVIEITDRPLADIRETTECRSGEVGELIVQGPVVTTEYVTGTAANATAKIGDGEQFWHRMGDVGYLDADDRFWFCGRKAHRVRTRAGEMYTIPCEAIVNQHPHMYRSALVGSGPSEDQMPAMICEPWPEHFPKNDRDHEQLLDELFELAQSHPLTHRIARGRFALHRSLPVDIRHNAKIFREQLAEWAAENLPAVPHSQPEARRLWHDQSQRAGLTPSERPPR